MKTLRSSSTLALWALFFGLNGTGVSSFAVSTASNSETSSAASASESKPETFNFENRLNDFKKMKGSEDEKLQGLFKFYFDTLMRNYPEWASSIGYPGYDHLWTDQSPTALNERRRQTKVFKELADQIRTEKLASPNQVSLELLKYNLEDSIRSDQFPDELLPLSQMDGIQLQTAQFLADLPLNSDDQVKDLMTRFRALPDVIEQTMSWMNEGVKKKVTYPAIAMNKVPEQFDILLPADPSKSPLIKFTEQFPDRYSSEKKNQLKKEAFELYSQKIRPAFLKLKDFIVKTYLPACRQNVAWNSMPQGSEWYNEKIRHNTTVNKSAREIHQLGLSEVERIQNEMKQILKNLKFKGSFQAFDKSLQKNPRYAFKTREEMLDAYRALGKKIDPELPRLFKTLPRLTYGVRPVPPHEEKASAGAYYNPGSLEAGRPGWFYLNTYKPQEHTRSGMETLFLHEAVPGHHFQISIAQEQSELPDFRKHDGNNAYTEGWGLYAESLGDELGLYKDPVSRFGHLSDEMLRAVRLVVDTGMHELGWSRDRALKFFIDSTGKPEKEAVSEIDRYLVWPGQALAYKMGQLKLQELRKKAQSQLGDRFDVRLFHDEVLKNGSVPLLVLEKLIDQWIQRQGTGPTAGQEQKKK